MRKTILPLLALGFLVLPVLLAHAKVAAGDVPRITQAELEKKLDDPQLTVIDLRKEKHWKASERKIRGAVRKTPLRADLWAGALDPSRTYVLYCA